MRMSQNILIYRIHLSLRGRNHFKCVGMNYTLEAKNAKETKEKKQRLMELLADKQDEELRSKSAAELQAMIDALG